MSHMTVIAMGAPVMPPLSRTDVPVELLLARVVCKTLVSYMYARKLGLYLQDLPHVLVVRCITRALHTDPIRHRLLITFSKNFFCLFRG